jgi:hypothetical protein
LRYQAFHDENFGLVSLSTYPMKPISPLLQQFSPRSYWDFRNPAQD